MPETPYDRLGGSDGIAQLVEDAVNAHLSNPIVKTRFEIHSKARSSVCK